MFYRVISKGYLSTCVETEIYKYKLYKYEGRTPINANTGGRADVMQT